MNGACNLDQWGKASLRFTYVWRTSLRNAVPSTVRTAAWSPMHEERAMSKDDVPTHNPHEYDQSAKDRVEKKPKSPESPQQQHDDEDHG